MRKIWCCMSANSFALSEENVLPSLHLTYSCEDVTIVKDHADGNFMCYTVTGVRDGLTFSEEHGFSAFQISEEPLDLDSF